MPKASALAHFFKLSLAERRVAALAALGLPREHFDGLGFDCPAHDDLADHIVENAIGAMPMPIGLSVNLTVDGKDHLVPMVTEESSVVAACSHASELLRSGGGVHSEVTPPHMVGQIQLLEVADLKAATEAVLGARAELFETANGTDPALVGAGGGVVGLEVRQLPARPNDPCGDMLVVHLIVDVRDAMGANAVDTMCEAIAPRIEALARGRVALRVLTHLADRRLVTVTGQVPFGALAREGMSGEDVARRIEEASVFAERDPYRATTHNKWTMNGIDAALIALGQDFRAVEAGAHAFAARGGTYTALATWRVGAEALIGTMTLPMAVGTVGGIGAVHPTVKQNRRLAEVESAKEMAAVVAAVGLAQNLGALRALSAEGIRAIPCAKETIQMGHMRLHGRNVAILGGATGDEVDLVAEEMSARGSVSVESAKGILEELRGAPSLAQTEPSDGATVERKADESGEAAHRPAPARRAGLGRIDRDGGADLGFCYDLLPLVSRTFALSIQALPTELRDAIAISYLLCRVVDTVEDDRAKSPEVRRALFDAFDAALDEAREGGADRSLDFEALSVEASLGPTDHERRLCKGASAVFAAFGRLPEEQRVAIFPSVAEMSRGMRAYSERADAELGLKLRNLEDLEKYCYYVAGTVGELLTKLFALSFPVSPEVYKALESRSVAFGLGLQLVNILKDVGEDAARGDCFLPEKEASDAGFDLKAALDPAQRSAGLTLLRQVSLRARQHLESAEIYTLTWPLEGGASAAQVRLFCAVPLALALATLREVELGTDALVLGRAPTVTRALVMQVFEDALRACRPASSAVEAAEHDELLKQLFIRARTGVVGRPTRPTTTLPSEPAPERISDPPRSVRPDFMSEFANRSSRGSFKEAKNMSEKMSSSPPERKTFHTLGGKILVTGAAGHVGANLMHRLVKDGHDVRALIRPGSDNSAVDAAEKMLGRKVERVLGDLRHLEDAEKATRGADFVFHVAARVSTLSATDQDLRDLYECNVIGTKNLLRAAGEAGVKRTVVTGSLSAVGTDLDHPEKPCDESMSFYPFSEHLPYGRTKSLVEHETLKAVVEGVDAVIATSCAVVGPLDYKPSRMGRTLLDFAHGKLRAYLPGGFDFVSTYDLTEGHLLAMEHGRTGQRYILSTEFTTVDELMDLFEEVSGKKRPRLRLPPTVMAGVAEVTSFFMSNFFPERPQRFTPAAVRLLRMARRADTTKAQTELGYRPTNVRAAIVAAYADFVARGLASPGPVSPALREPAADVQPKSKEGAAA